MRIIGEKLNFDDVLLVPQRSTLTSRKDVILEREFKFYHSDRIWKGIPIITANMPAVGNFSFAKILSEYKMITCLHKYVTINEIKENKELFHKYGDYIWVSIGKNDEEIHKLKEIEKVLEGYIPNICIDVPNGYLESFVHFCRNIRVLCPEPIILAGNITTPEMAQELIIHGGVDICKVGIGPSKVCDTRIQTGVGYGQLSAIDECSGVAHGLKSQDRHLGLICGDGGCKTPGDVCKAFAAGADFVMLGTYFAGAEESEGEWTYKCHERHSFGGILSIDEKDKFKFYGMSSHHAQEKHGSGIKDYRASEGNILWLDNKGPAAILVRELLGGIRSSCTYIGANCIKDMPKCAHFCRVNSIK